jgi:hypothetical protein
MVIGMWAKSGVDAHAVSEESQPEHKNLSEDSQTVAVQQRFLTTFIGAALLLGVAALFGWTGALLA